MTTYSIVDNKAVIVTTSDLRDHAAEHIALELKKIIKEQREVIEGECFKEKENDQLLEMATVLQNTSRRLIG